MSTKYQKPEDVPTEVICKRLRELSRAANEYNRAEFTLRVPAELDRDADLVLHEAAKRLEQKQ